MKVYLAPLENITTLVYRNTIHEMFGDSIDMYFMPFMMPHIKIGLDEKDCRELSHELNDMENLVPQILTDDAEDFWRMAQGMVDLGYREININIGCPSHKVASKGRGSGFLKRKEKLDQFLYDVFDKNQENIAISVKSRLGRDETDGFYEVLDIYNKYPLKELILHPRTGIQRYSGKVHREFFFHALEHSRNPLCYNGDIFNLEDYQLLKKEIKDTFSEKANEMENRMTAIMLGRGLLGNPALGRELKGGKKVTGEELLSFMELYRENCMKFPRISEERILLNKSKEIWTFMRRNYPENEMEIRRMLLSQNLEEYLRLEKHFLSNI